MIQTNCKKYVNKQYVIHTTDERGAATHKRDPKPIALENAEKEICLNCTKKKCSGTRECFNKERLKNI